MKEIRLFISVPSCREWKPAFGASLISLVYTLLAPRKEQDFVIKQVYPDIAAQASCLSQARQGALTKAINGNFTHWLSLDDDMQFPGDVVEKMLIHEKPVVTANYRRKSPNQIVGVCMGLEGFTIDSTGKTGLEEIGWMGGGMFLADIEKIKHISAPHFEVSWCKERNDYYDQDYYFSAKLRQHGVGIWLDHDLSQSIKHVGDYHFAWPQELLKLVKDAA